MKVKSFFASVIFLSSVLSTNNIQASFSYEYQIITNSYALSEKAKNYAYEQKLIETYKKLCFNHLTRDYQEIIMNNINEFSFDEYVSPYYTNGAIVLFIGLGKGPIIRGKLMKNECDNETINEKFFIFELFD